ncbi:flavin-containing monooxygenase, partial [Mycetocola reblochoni]
MTAARVHDVVVVGAGFAGLAASLALSEAGIDDHLVLEAAAEVGGTWRDNRYPGVACDIPAPQYTLSRRRRSRWTAPFAPGAEIRDYLRDIAAEPGVAERLRTSTPLSSAAWDEAAGLWRITTPRGLLATRALILCAGRFGSPLVPDVPGYGSFGGDIVHSARWRDDAAIDGADVVVVGTG